jgi:formamidopyrimidine-DNA glycosylase
VPELPDIEVYLDRLRALIGGKRLERVRLKSPFLLRTVDPALATVHGKRVETLERIGKRIVIGFENELCLVIHLMVSGRLQWRPAGANIVAKIGLCAFDFSDGTLLMTEASTKKRASLHLVRGRENLADFYRGGIEPLEADFEEFRAALLSENRTLKRALVDPRLFSGIGNAYSDEILHRARLSPFKRTQTLEADEVSRLREACLQVLREWTEKLRAEVGSGFPEKVTAFREGMAVHGRYQKPCPVCGTKVQRVRYADNEVNYCPKCQTEGRLLADRGLSQLLKKDWPKSLEELEERLGKG